jgi:hypothetical protein
MCGSDPDNFINAMAAEGLVFAPKPEPKDESNLVEHARVELELIGEEPDTIDGYLKVLQAFADMGHSGGSTSVAIPVLFKLLCQKNLGPLTDDPNEWIFHDKNTYGSGQDLWQNKRNGEAFSLDAGKTYYIISEVKKRIFVDSKRKMYKSERSMKEQT